MSEPEGAIKPYFHLDSGKPRVDLLPPQALEAAGAVFEYGMSKYGHRNWEAYAEDWSWGQLLGSSLRHLYAWMRGVDLDRESGLPHLAHALTNLMMLLALVSAGQGKDDRQLKTLHEVI